MTDHPHGAGPLTDHSEEAHRLAEEPVDIPGKDDARPEQETSEQGDSGERQGPAKRGTESPDEGVVNPVSG